MSVIYQALLLLLFGISCQSKEPAAAPPASKEAVYFSTSEVITTLVSLVAIIDWPQETIAHQKNLGVTQEKAKKLILPLHPLWDEKISEVSVEMSGWDKAKIQQTASTCKERCECEFYQEVLEKNPIVLEQAPDLKAITEVQYVRTKEGVLKCMQNMISIQKLIGHLEQELKDYQAPGL